MAKSPWLPRPTPSRGLLLPGPIGLTELGVNLCTIDPTGVRFICGKKFVCCSDAISCELSPSKFVGYNFTQSACVTYSF